MSRQAQTSSSVKKRTDIDRLLHALNHPIRRRILIALAQEHGSASSLAKSFREHLGVVSYHLNKVLDQECGVVDLVERVKVRGAQQKVYALKRESVLGVLDSPDLPDLVRQSLMGTALKEFFVETIAAIEAGAIDSPDPDTLEWDPVRLDGQGWQDILDAAEQFKERVQKAVGDSRSRKSAGSKEVFRSAIIGVALFETANGHRRLNGTA